MTLRFNITRDTIAKMRIHFPDPSYFLNHPVAKNCCFLRFKFSCRYNPTKIHVCSNDRPAKQSWKRNSARLKTIALQLDDEVVGSLLRLLKESKGHLPAQLKERAESFIFFSSSGINFTLVMVCCFVIMKIVMEKRNGHNWWLS